MSLTRYREGSLKELWAISYPLMISSLSMMAMLFVDRLLLAHHSTESLNAAVNASTFGWAFVFAWQVLASISEVFVAQSNGEKNYSELGRPVWQMLWLSILSSLFFVPFAFWGSQFFYQEANGQGLERSYFFWMLLFGPSFPFYAALCGFFIGQGKTSLITWLAIFANLVNAVFDYVLIFGIEGWVPSFGITGAAIATCGSQVFQALVLFIAFLSKNNREAFGTGNCFIDKQLFKDCLRIGLPGAIFTSVEIMGWAAYYHMMTILGPMHITIASICQTIIILCFFFGEGLSKGATTIAGNLIGLNKKELIADVMQAGIKLNFIFFAFLVVMFALFGDMISRQFLPNLSEIELRELAPTLTFCFTCITFAMLFEGMRMFFSGLLTAAGDTRFLLIGGSLATWVFMVLPIYAIVVQNELPVESAIVITSVSGLLSCFIYYQRFQSGRWRQLAIR